MILHCGKRPLDLSSPKIMGILNVTPDSFYDGGRHYKADAPDLSSVLRTAERMVEDGAHILDVGGESTRPGADVVSVAQECDRVLPVVEALATRVDAVISVDTSTPAVMRESAALGAGLINDVRALEREGAVNTILATGLPVCLMHMQGSPETMQDNPGYQDVINEVAEYLQTRVDLLLSAAGARQPQILLDPGIGFGKTDEHNVALLKHLAKLGRSGYPLLVGVSRKSLIGRLLGRQPQERLAGSLAFAMAALMGGAKILRVHDVPETRDLVEVFNLTQFGS